MAVPAQIKKPAAPAPAAAPKATWLGIPTNTSPFAKTAPVPAASAAAAKPTTFSGFYSPTTSATTTPFFNTPPAAQKTPFVGPFQMNERGDYLVPTAQRTDVFGQPSPSAPDPKAKPIPKPAEPYSWQTNLGGTGFGTKDYEAAIARGYTNEDVSKYILANESKFGPEGINVAENIQRKLNLPYTLVDPQKEALANPAKLAKGIWRYAGTKQVQLKAPKRVAGGSQFSSSLAIPTPSTLPQATASDLLRGRRALMIQRSRGARGGVASTMPLGFTA